ncbi:MAG: hypothetical protein ACRDH0_05310 [Actinomycetota bacterium]
MWKEVVPTLFLIGSLAIAIRSSRRLMRQAEQRNLDVLDAIRAGQPLAEPEPPSWETLGTEPRTYHENRSFWVFALFVQIVVIGSFLFLSAWVSGLLSVVALVIASYLTLGWVWAQLRCTASVTLAPGWIEVTRRWVGTRRWTWEEVLSVRQVWNGTHTGRTITINLPGVRFRTPSPMLVDFDEFLALVLMSVPGERIDRRPPSARERFPVGAYVPSSGEEAGPLPLPQPRQLMWASLYSLPLIVALLTDMVGLMHLLPG